MPGVGLWCLGVVVTCSKFISFFCVSDLLAMYCTSVGSKFLTELFSLEFGFRVCVPSFVDFICRACLILRTCSTVLFLGKYRVGQ